MLRFIEGFNAVSDDVRMARFYESYTGLQFVVNENAMHNGLNFAKCAAGYDQVLRTRSLVSPDQNSWVLGFAFRVDNTIAVNAGDIPYVALRNDDGEQIRLEFIQDNPASAKPGGTYYTLRVVRGVTTLATMDQKFNIGSSDDQNRGWTYFEFKVTIDNAVGSIELRYHERAGQQGQQTGTWDSATTNLDTQQQTTTGANRLEMSWQTGNSQRRVAFSDIYALDSSGSVNNDFLGRTAVVVQKPDDPAEGDTDAWVLAGGAGDLNEAWDEPANGGIDDERNTSDNTGDVSLALVPDVPFLRLATIHGVAQHLTCKMETTGTLTLHHRWRKTTGTPAEVDGTNFVVSSTTWVGDTDLRELDPNTALAFVVADLDAYQHGVRNGG